MIDVRSQKKTKNLQPQKVFKSAIFCLAVLAKPTLSQQKRNIDDENCIKSRLFGKTTGIQKQLGIQLSPKAEIFV